MADPTPPNPTYQMLWRCTQCHTADLLALTQRFCPACGAAQDPDQRYFPPPGQEVEVKNHRYVGADWPCAYCEAPNAAASAFCTHCGAPKDGHKEVARVASPDEAATPPSPPSAPAQPAQPAATPSGFPWGKAVLAVLLLALVGWATLFFSRHDETAQVVQQQWARSVEIEQYTAVSESAWCDSLPAGAYQVSRGREQRGTRQVEDGQVCHDVRQDQGDGTFIKRRECETRWRDEPVYDDRCRFRLNRWQALRTDALQGDATLAPAWPQPRLGNGWVANGPALLGMQRLGARTERYEVKVRSSQGKEWTCTLPEARWAALRPHTPVTLAVRGTGGADCATLAPAAAAR